MGAWQYAGTIGNVYSYAHAKYGANRYEQRLLRDQHFLVFLFPNFTFRALGVESSREGAIIIPNANVSNNSRR